MTNFYKVLGLSPQATQEEIESMCLRLGDIYRPDKNPSDPEAEYKFREIEEAFNALQTPEKRAAYDAQLQEKRTKLNKYMVGAMVAVIAVGIAIKVFPTRTSPVESPKSSIEPSCSTNGLGNATCTFQNTGNANGATCVQIKLAQKYSSVSALSDKICSGIVLAGDVRQMTAFVQFRRDYDKQVVAPKEFCAGVTDWIGACRLTVVQAY